MAYRDAPFAAPKRSSGDGVVDEMVRQFADRHAFVRELVQNAIDAGATRIEIGISRRGDGTITTTVDDDGAGMTRATIEGPLLTLFSSSKEDDPTKIGKYGVGFVSIFATEPDQVDVFTWRSEGAWRVRLFGDHTFELETEAIQPGHGTVVSLVHRIGADAAEEYVARVTAALERWCRHAHVPIAISLDGSRRVINQPLFVEGLVVHEAKAGPETIVVGAGVAFAGFYNRGLTLFETTVEPELEAPFGIGFKIDSPTLGHTISRDNVKRDAAFRGLLQQVQLLVKGPLRDAMYVRFGEAASAHDAATCHSILAVLEEADPKRLVVPLLRGVIPIAKALEASSVVVAKGPSPIALALERRSLPVVIGFDFAPILRRFTKKTISSDTDAWALAIPVDRDDDPLLIALGRALRDVGVSLARVRFGSFAGARVGETFRWVTANDGLCEAAHIQVKGSSDATLFLNVEDPAVRLARRKPEVGVAAHLLARIVMLEAGPLSKSVVDKMLEAASG